MPDLAPYTPALYMPGNFGRYRSYPRRVRTPIPGAGYDASLAWAEQPLNLWGVQRGVPATRYGRYAPAPLLGLGALFGLGQNAAINRELGYSKSAMRKYWDARAQQCRMMADEGQCLARVARHVPVTIGSYYQEGVGQAPIAVTVDTRSMGQRMWNLIISGSPDGGTGIAANQHAVLGVVGATWLVGWWMGYWWRGRRVKANRRRLRANRRRGRR